MKEQLAQLAERCCAEHLRLATAESCTGGWIAKVLTDLPGSSVWFEAGIVSYSNEAKQSLLGVDAATIAQYGAVSEETVRAMAKGVLNKTNAHLSVAVSGVAGPGGGSEEKPVGTVWLAWFDSRNEHCWSQCYQFEGDRDQVRTQSVEAAINGLLDLVKS